MADPGDAVYLGSILTNVHIWGVVSDIDTPAAMTGTFEILGNDGAITMDALVGPQGPAGENAPIVKMQYGSGITDPDDLPQDLTDNEIDIGKAWWIGNQIYLWSGDAFVQKAMGTAGPPGPVPLITPSVLLLDPDGPDPSEIVVSGTATNPTWLLKLKAPRGPIGESGPIRGAADYDNTDAPQLMDVIAWNGVKYAPCELLAATPKIYSVPEAAFTNYTGLTTRHQIGSFAVPPQPWSWTPVVFGHIRAIGIELDTDPLILGSEVRLGDAMSGTLIARGFGNISTYAHIVPHYSTQQSPNDAISPENNVARVPANHTGTAGTVYVNLFNDGLMGAYNFSKTNAQLLVMVVPVGASMWGS